LTLTIEHRNVVALLQTYYGSLKGGLGQASRGAVREVGDLELHSQPGHQHEDLTRGVAIVKDIPYPYPGSGTLW
jgi:hypothetical protein